MTAYPSSISLKFFITAQAYPILPCDAGIFFGNFDIDNFQKIRDFAFNIFHPFFQGFFVDFTLD